MVDNDVGEGNRVEGYDGVTVDPERDGLDIARPEFRPDPELSRDEMEDLQRGLAETARFEDDVGFDPDAVAVGDAADLTAGVPEPPSPDERRDEPNRGEPIVVGIDQAFLEDRVVSAAVAVQGGVVVDRTAAVSPLSIPYVPGLLAFREGGPILDALATLETDPDVLVLDGSGRIHFRQAGIAVHVGVLVDRPALGVAKNLLCGEPDDPVDERPAGWSTPIRADSNVDAADGTVIGHAYQSKQYPKSRRVNPLYISPGHRLSAETTLDLVAELCAGYKLPEPTRLADAFADEVKRAVVNR